MKLLNEVLPLSALFLFRIRYSDDSIAKWSFAWRHHFVGGDFQTVGTGANSAKWNRMREWNNVGEWSEYFEFYENREWSKKKTFSFLSTTAVHRFSQTTVDGLTGTVKFDTDGRRTEFQVQIQTLTSHGSVPIGTWSPNDGIAMEKLGHATLSGIDSDQFFNRTFIVLTTIVCENTECSQRIW